MKKYHYFIIILTFAIYGFIFYQKFYAGPDDMKYFRDKGDLITQFIDEPDKYLGKNYKLYSEYNLNGVPDILDDTSLIYFKKDKTDLELACNSVTDYGEITGTIVTAVSNGEKYFYYKNIQSIFAYENSDTDNKGMKIKCYPF
jgi:hypothetical protein